MTFSALATRTTSTNKKSSRAGSSVKRLIVHHTAGGSNEGNESELTVSAREVSANYLLRTDAQLIGIVPEEYRAWTSGYDADIGSVTVETVNTTGPDDDPAWAVSDGQLERLAQLAADLCIRYGWGRVDESRVDGHRDWMNTACPGPYLYPRLGWIIDRANQLLGGGAPSGPSPVQQSGNKSIDQLVDEVLAGDWGNGVDRTTALNNAGYDAGAVQAAVNARLSGDDAPSAPAPSGDLNAIADQVLAGNWGNGDDRVSRLTQAGYDYNAVQALVNQKLGGGGAAPAVDISSLADRVIAGEFGNGDDRRNALGANYDAVQAEVNRKLQGQDGPSSGPDIGALADAVIRGDYGNGDDRRNALGGLYDQVQAEVNRRLG